MLYYSVQETTRFRQEYREERCKLKQDEQDFEETSVCNLGEPGSDNNMSCGDSQGTIDAQAKNDSKNTHRFYKIVVKHKNTIETFVDKGMGLSSSLPGKVKTADGDFFDNASFWNG